MAFSLFIVPCCLPHSCLTLQGGGDVDLWGNRLHSFCIGLEGSPDLKAGKEVAQFLGTDHHEFTFTVQVCVCVCLLTYRAKGEKVMGTCLCLVMVGGLRQKSELVCACLREFCSVRSSNMRLVWIVGRVEGC